MRKQDAIALVATAIGAVVLFVGALALVFMLEEDRILYFLSSSSVLKIQRVEVLAGSNAVIVQYYDEIRERWIVPVDIARRECGRRQHGYSISGEGFASNGSPILRSASSSRPSRLEFETPREHPTLPSAVREVETELIPDWVRCPIREWRELRFTSQQIREGVLRVEVQIAESPPIAFECDVNSLCLLKGSGSHLCTLVYSRDSSVELRSFDVQGRCSLLAPPLGRLLPQAVSSDASTVILRSLGSPEKSVLVDASGRLIHACDGLPHWPAGGGGARYLYLETGLSGIYELREGVAMTKLHSVSSELSGRRRILESGDCVQIASEEALEYVSRNGEVVGHDSLLSLLLRK